MKTYFSQLFNNKRFKSLLWRAGAMILAFMLDYTIMFFTNSQIPPYIAVSLGLIFGEISKALHNYLNTTPI